MSSLKNAEALLADMETQAKKSKFGYFNMPPNPFVGDTLVRDKTSHRGPDGRVIVPPRNVFSGVTATGILKKSFFSYPAKTADAYYDPGKLDSLTQLSKSKLLEGKEPYKPPSGSLEPSPTAAYPYVLDKQPPRDPKACRDVDGKVKTENPNISGGTAFKACQNRLKAYMSANILPLAPLKEKPVFKENDAPFVPCGKKGLQFSTLKQTFGSVPLKETKPEKQCVLNIMHHESEFRPSNRALQQDFSRPKYIPTPPEVISEKNPSPRKVQTDRNPFKQLCIDLDSPRLKILVNQLLPSRGLMHCVECADYINYMPEYYTQLGVPINATPQDIKRAFKKAMLQCHPDKQINKDNRKAMDVIDAYRVLSNRETRAAYDYSLKQQMRKMQRYYQVQQSRMRQDVLKGESNQSKCEEEIECEQCEGVTKFDKFGQQEQWLVSCAHCGAIVKVQ